MTAYVFLGLNGDDVEMEESDVTATIERAASGRIGEPALGKWFRENLRRLDQARPVGA